MEFFVPDAKHVGFRDIDPLIASFLLEIPGGLQNLSDAAEQRLFPPPSGDDAPDELRADWKSYVEEELDSHFRSARDVVASDLRGMTRADDVFELSIPVSHIDAWLNVLNQIRLALAADFGFDEKLLDATSPEDITVDQGIAIHRIDLYGFMQQCLVDQME